MIETIGLGAGSYPEPDWCHEDPEDTYEQSFEEDYEGYMADYYHDLMMTGELNG